MFGAVKECVENYMRSRPQVTLRTDRVIGFDVTNGAIDGCCYLFFGEGGSAPSLVAKAARTPEGKAVFETEQANLERLKAKGMNETRSTVPAPLGRWEDGATLITLQSALDGSLMKNVPGRSLFSPAQVESRLEAILDWWLHLQRCFGIHSVVLAGDVYAREVLQPVERFRRRYLLAPAEETFLSRRFERERTLEDLELPLMVRHGDFCAANLVLQEHGIGVFDWEFPLRHQLPLFDLFYFLGSLRFPYTGRGGESSHLDSLASVYWEDSYFRSAMRNCLRRASEQHGIPRHALGDLFLLALIEVANLKYDSMLVSHGVHEGDDFSEQAKRARWSRFDEPERDEPFARIRDGVFESLSLVVKRGIPEL